MTKFGLEALEKTPSINLDSDPLIENTSPPFPNPNGIFINVKIRVSETLRHAFELFPNYRQLYVITGNSNTDFYFTGLLKKSAAEFASTHHFTFINGITLDSMLIAVAKIPRKSIVVIPLYLADKNNVPLDSKSLPSQSIYFNREHDFPGEYKWYILGGILFLILETFMIAYLFKLIIRQKAIGKQKAEAPKPPPIMTSKGFCS